MIIKLVEFMGVLFLHPGPNMTLVLKFHEIIPHNVYEQTGWRNAGYSRLERLLIGIRDVIVADELANADDTEFVVPYLALGFDELRLLLVGEWIVDDFVQLLLRWSFIIMARPFRYLPRKLKLTFLNNKDSISGVTLLDQNLIFDHLHEMEVVHKLRQVDP